jgi:predicted negative regulator of RcsB-dependent stress response
MYDLEEQEKLDALKAFWKDNGRLIIAAAIAFVAGLSAVQGWRYYTRVQAEAASALFAQLEEAQGKSDTKEMRNVGGRILDKYGRTAYGPMAAMILANADYAGGDREAAARQLQWILDRAGDDETAALARLRLAGIRLEEKKYDEALKLLDARTTEAFVSQYSDLRGDVLVAQGKLAEARAAYRQALDKAAEQSQWRGLVQIKLDALGSTQ